MLIIDFRTSHFTPEDVPDFAWVPLGSAHLIVGRARATIYRWVQEDRLATIESGEAGKALKLHVCAGHVREIEARMRRAGHAETRRASNARQ